MGGSPCCHSCESASLAPQKSGESPNLSSIAARGKAPCGSQHAGCSWQIRCAKKGRVRMLRPMPLMTLTLDQAMEARRCGDAAAALALLAVAGEIPLAPSFVLSEDAVAEIANAGALPATVLTAIDTAWQQIGTPQQVRLRTAEGQSHSVTVRTASALLRAAQRAAQESVAASATTIRAVLIQADGAAGGRGAHGVVHSEDADEDRLDQIHITAWPGSDHTPSSPAVRYRVSRRGDAVITEAEPHAPVLLPSTVISELARIARAAETTLAEPVTLEWAWDDVQVVVTGAGPIITPLPWGIFRDSPQLHDSWTRANAGEIFPKPVTPLTWSLVQEPLDHAFAAIFHQPRWTDGRRFVALADAYLYFNFGLVYHINVERLGAPSRHAVEAVGGPDTADGLRLTNRGLHPLAALRQLPYILRMIRRQQRIPDEWPQHQQQLEAERERLAALPLHTMDAAALLRAMTESQMRTGGVFDFFMEAQGATYATFTIVRTLLDLFLHDAGLATALIQGLPGVRTAEANLALWRVAERAAADPATRDAVAQHAPQRLLPALRAQPATLWLAEGLETYVAEYGHRSAGELELMEPRWADDPTPLFTTFRGYVLSPGHTSADALVDRQRRAREEAERTIDRRLTAHWWERLFPVRRMLVRYFTRWAQRYAPLRENPKFVLLATTYQQRRVLMTLADRLVDSGVLRDPNDVFFLSHRELATLALRPSDVLAGGRMRSRIRRRRAFYVLAAARTPAPVLGAALEISPSPVTPAKTGDPETPHLLRGLAASPGVVEGIAHVAITPEEASGLQPGEILVARFTDPGWTPLFPLAAAVITEIGGILSHGAIVAREYGLPAVVNVRNATQEIRSGHRLRVDGGAGTVELLG